MSKKFDYFDIDVKIVGMQRSIEKQILSDLEEKLVLLGGPRQVGKTTLAQGLYPNQSDYLNYDVSEDRLTLLKKNWDRQSELVIFDELHKMPKWKSWIKGIYDKEGVRPRLLVTGSARLDTYRKGGDSMAGRFFYHRLHPFSLAEVRSTQNEFKGEALDHLMRFGGFPEPFFKGSEVFAARWRRSHLDRILREDLLDLEQVRNLKGIEILVDLLADRVGSTVSYSSLGRDLQVAPRTVQRWVELLERLFVVFVVTPYSKNVARSVLKEPKIYFYDLGRVKKDVAARFENLVACALFKRMHFLEDSLGETRGLFYLRDKNKREVDFLTILNKEAEWLIEVKTSDPTLSTSLQYFSGLFKNAKSFQLLKNFNHSRSVGGVELVEGASWLSQLEA